MAKVRARCYRYDLSSKYNIHVADRPVELLEADHEQAGPGSSGVVTVAAATDREPYLLQMDGAGHCIIPSDSDLGLLTAKDLSRAVREVCTAEYGALW